MQKIRRSTMKHRKLLIAVVIVLSIGLIGSFAVWSSNSDYTGNEATTLDYIETYEAAVAETLPAEGEAMTYEAAGQLADLHNDLRALYYQAYTEYYPYDAEAADYTQKLEQANMYYLQYIDNAEEAAGYYEQELALAPENLNDFARGEIIAYRAAMLTVSGNTETAAALFEEAMEMAPENFNVAGQYVQFVYSNEGIEAVRETAQAYMGLVGEDDANYVNMEQLLASFEQMEQINAELEALRQEQNNANSEDDHDPSDQADDANTEE